MKAIPFFAIGAACAALSLTNARQMAAQDAQPVIYASYYECDPGSRAAADSLVRTFWTPIFDRHVAAKHATAWGWLGHHTGNRWSRAFYVVSSDIGNALDATAGVLADAATANPAALRETNAACPVHEDYIWQQVTGSQSAAERASARPAARFAIYYECDPAREQRADAIVTSSFTPILAGLVQSGDLTSWVWLQHLVGGKYRRVLATDGRDAKTVIGAIGKASTELRTKQTEAFREFSQICGSHQDVVWNILVAKP